MKKLLGILVLGLLWCNVSASNEINYKKTILNNKIVGTFKDIANHEWIFKDDGTRLYNVYSIPSLERIHSSSDCWIPKKNYRILEYKECDSNEILGTMQFSFEDMGLIVNTRHGELLIYKLIEPIKIIYEIQHEWTKVQKTNSGRVGYVDLVNLKKDGDHMYYWDLIDYGKPDQYGDSSNTVYWKVNCITLASKMIKQLFYKGPMATGAGKSIPLKSHQKGWVAVGPGTFGDKAARMVCKKKYDM